MFLTLIKSFLPVDNIWFKILGCIALVSALIGGYSLWRHNIYQSGYDAADTYWKDTNKKANLQAEKRLSKLDAEVDSKQAQIENMDKLISEIYKEKENDKINFNNLRNTYANDIKRLRLNGATCKSGGTENGSDSGSTSESGQGGSVVLMPETSVSFIDVAGGTVNTVQKLNECIDRYNKIKDIVNKKNEKS